MRVGLDTGVEDAKDVVVNPTTGRTQYTGRLLCTAKAVAGCGHGGMVLLSHAAFRALPAADLQSTFGQVINMGEYAFSDPNVEPGAVYQVVAAKMQARLAYSASWGLRSVTQLQAGALQAPMQNASVAFCNVVGAAALLAWDAEVAGRALQLYHQRAAQAMMRAPDAGASVRLGAPQPGYVVEMGEGLCLAAFCSPLRAVGWAVQLVHELLEAPWEPELLANELCEEVAVTSAQGVVRTSIPSGTRDRRRRSVAGEGDFWARLLG